MTEYCVDTSALIDAWVRSYPQDAFPTFWTNVDCMIGNGSLICPDEVLHELEKQEDDLHQWGKNRPALFYPIDEELQLAVRQVLGDFPRLVDTKRFRHQADPFLIALAKITGRTVVSGEKNSGRPDAPKIPDVCARYGIRCITVLQLIREQQWRF